MQICWDSRYREGKNPQLLDSIRALCVLVIWVRGAMGLCLVDASFYQCTRNDCRRFLNDVFSVFDGDER